MIKQPMESNEHPYKLEDKTANIVVFVIIVLGLLFATIASL